MNIILLGFWGVVGVYALVLLGLLLLLILGKMSAFFVVLTIVLVLTVLLAVFLRINLKSESQIYHEMQYRNQEIRDNYAEIDIDDIRQNEEIRKEIIDRGYPSTKTKLTLDNKKQKNI